ncbi:SAM-dependent methyltransferase [Streptomyces sp. NBC_00160]|uniref:SAM-dependent methyltransferase n=1 Tax=Streptomyces sp. NBC_00160 TaxID=2903628 RepID=UPI002253AAC3|nr:SAM-dependent methyltransferase [Streptomyces sp. NBC_00160]MCX5303024.1 SAM-dependent methyltransferase [Streptomyces sp. NBC_00160]
MNSHQITRGDLLEALASPTALSACMTLPSRPESVKTARDFVADQLARWCHPDLEDSATLVCSELVTNAITHGTSDPATSGCMVALTLVPGEALITQVADSDPAPPVPRVTFSGALAEDGRGLSIVTKLSAYWSASPRPDGKGKVVSAYLLTNHDTSGPSETAAVELFLPDRTPSAGRTVQDSPVPTPTPECEPELPKLDLSTPSVARVCDFITGGTDNYSADRALGRPLLTAAPWLDRAAAAARNHGQETVTRLAAQGITQFLDLGCGLPQRHGRNTHDAAQRHRPESTVVYVDRDPMVQAHVRTWLAETPRELDLHADVTRTAHLLDQPAITRLDHARPIAVLLHEVLPWISDGKARHLLEALRNWLPAGSVLSVVHAAADSHPESTPALAGLYRKAGILYRPRSLKQLLALVRDWHVEAPGISAVPLGGLHAVGGRAPLYGSYAFVARGPHPSATWSGQSAAARDAAAGGAGLKVTR